MKQGKEGNERAPRRRRAMKTTPGLKNVHAVQPSPRTSQSPDQKPPSTELISNTTVELFRLLTSDSDLHDLMRAATLMMMQWTGCEAIGIRLREGDDFPYYETRGFPPEFLRLENSLCAVDLDGQIKRDSAGSPVLECMCGNILCGRFNPAKPFFTEGGSFWTNCTSDLLRTTADADRQARTRNRCNGEGYESVALIALRSGSTTYGLLQLNDKRKDMFNPELMRQLEGLAQSLALAIAHRQAQHALEQSELKFRSLFDQMLTGCAMHRIVCDEEGRPVDYVTMEVNSEFERLLGVRREDVVAKSALEVAPGLDPSWIANFGKVALEGGVWRYEQYAANVDKWFQGVAYSPGKGLFIVTFVDISDRKRAETEARESGFRFASFMENSPSAAVIKNAADEILYANRAFEKAFELGRQGWLNKRDTDLWDAKVTREMHRNDLETLANGGPRTYEEKMLHPDGKIHTWVKQKFPFRDEKGNILLGVIGQDVTAESELAEALRASELKFSTVFDASPAILAISSLEDGKYIDVNESFLRVGGFTREEVLGRNGTELGIWDPASARDEYAHQLAVEGKVRGLEMSVRTKEGERRILLANADTISLPAGNVVLNAAVDITDRVQAERQLKIRLVELQRWHEVTLGREGRVQELKREVNSLLEKLGEPHRYSSVDQEFHNA
jgi:PAS domain S-box-containing protein